MLIISFILFFNENKRSEDFLMHLLYFNTIPAIYARSFFMYKYYILQSNMY